MAWTVWDGQQNVTTDNYQEMKAAVARREGGSPSSGGSTSSSPYSGGSRDGGVQIEGGNASNSYSMDGASYKKYEDDYHFWQETGTYRENAEVNQDEFSAWKAIHDATELGGKWGYAGGKYYTISDDAYNAYDDDYAYWQKNGKSKDEFQSNEADYNAWRTIRDTVNTTGSNIAYDENYIPYIGYVEGDEATYYNRIMDNVTKSYLASQTYDLSDPEDFSRYEQGIPSKYSERKYYDMSDPTDRYLFSKGLPSNKGNFLSKQFTNAREKVDKEVAAYNEEVGRFNAYNEQKSDFLTKLYGHMNEVRTADRERAAAAGTNPAMLDTGGEYDLADGYTEDNPMRAEFERYAGELLTSGKYDLVAQNLSLSQDMDSKTGFDAAMAYGKESAADAKAQEKTEDNPYVFDMSQYGLTTDELYEGYLEAEAGMQAAYDAEANGTNVGSPVETYLSEVATYDKDAATAARDEIVAQIGALDAQFDAAKQSGKPAEERAAAGYVGEATAESTADGAANTQMQREREALQFKLEVLENQIASAGNKEKIAAAEATVAEKYGGILSAPDFKAVSETPIGRYDGATMDRETYKDARHLEAVSERVNDIVPTSDPYYTSQFFTWDEFYTYRYIVNTQGAEAGLQYFHDMEPILNQRNYDNIEAISRRMATDNPVLHSICTVFQKLGSSVEGFNVTLDGAFYELSGGKTGRQLTYNDPRTSGTAIGNEVRSNVQRDITATSGELMGQLYGLGMSLSDNAMRAFVAKGIGALTGVSAIGSNAMAASMYGQVAASTVNEYMQQGAGSKQALLMGVLSAGAEAIGEAISLGELLKIKGTPGGALTKSSMFWNYMKRNALTEGGSEAITSVASYLFDWMVMQDESKLRTVYDDARLKGKTRGGAFFAAAGELFKEAAIEGVAGAISGSLLGGVNYVGSMYETGKSAGARAGSRISTGASAQADLFNAFTGLANAVNLTQEQYAAQNGITNQKQAARAYDKAVAKGMAIDPEMRLQIVADLNAIGMDKNAVEDMLTKLDPFLVSPASLASPELTTSLMKFSSVLKRAADVSAKQDAANQTRTVKAKQRLTALYDAVTNYQMAAVQAKSNGDVAGHARAINSLSEGITKYKNALAVYQSEAAEQKVQAEIEVRDAAKAVTDMADSIAATADTERAYQAERLTATIAEMAGDDTTNALLHMMGALQAQERAAQPLNTEAIEAEEAAAMENGDEARYHALQRIREAYGKGDATAYKDALDAYEAITGVNVGAAAADDTIDHIVNGGQNGAETQRADVSVPDAERGRNNDGARQRDVRREDRGGNAQPASEVAGVRSADAGNQKTVRNRATHEQWVEADKAGFRQKLSADINEQLGHGESLVAADDIETVDDVTPESKGYFAKAMNILGGNSPKLYRYKEGANRPVHGCAIAGREYVEYTGRTTDVFHLGHERAENTKAYRDAGFAALKAMGHYGDVVFDYYLASRGIRGIRGEQRAEMQKEFVCDMFGAYIADVALGLNLYGDLGVDDTTAREFADAFAKSMAAAAEVDGDGETEFSTAEIEDAINQHATEIDGIESPKSRLTPQRQIEYNEFVDNALANNKKNTEPFVFFSPEAKTVEKVKREYGIDIAERISVLTDNDTRHIRNRHGRMTDRMADNRTGGYVVLSDDIKAIPYILTEYDDVYYVKNADGTRDGLYYAVKGVDTTYYLEELFESSYLRGRQLIKTPNGVMPEIPGLKAAIRAKQNTQAFFDNVDKSNPEMYVQDVRQSVSIDTIPKTAAESKGNTEVNTKNLQFTPVAQAISSAKTSIKQVPALFTDKNAHFGKTNIDIGGGKYDLATDYLAGQGTQNMVFDPYNRMASENTETLGFLQAGSKADTATCANVLNVIAEPNARANVILEAAKAIGQDGRAYFMVYEGDGSGIGRTTSAGWQNNRKTADYVDEIGQYFGTVTRKGKLITAENPRSNLPKASWEITPGQAVEFSTNTVADPLRDADAAEAFNLYERGVSYGEYQNYPDAKPSVTKHLRGMWDKSRQIEAVREAERLYADGEDPISYYERAYKDKTYNPMVASQLRGMLIRNGKQVGGALSEGELRQLTENKENWKQLKNVRLSVTSPGRNFENLGMWRDNDIPSARAKNYEEGKRLRDNYFTFGQYQMAEKNKWMAEEGEKVRQAFGNGGTLESSIAQMLGEGMITDDDVQGARRGKDVTIVPRTDGGVFVLDNHFNLTAASDGFTTIMLDAQYRSRKEAKAKAIAAIKKNVSISDDKKASLIAAAQREYQAVKPQVQEYALQVSEQNGVLRVTAPTGKVIAEVANGQQADAACVTRTRDALRDFYDRALDRQNRALIENGYAPINKRNGYFPHQGRADIGVEGLISQLRDETLPTAISGETATFRPGKPFTTHLLKRLGDYTEFDATRGFDKYLAAAGDLIYSTPVIQRLRQLERTVRESEGTTNTALVSWLKEYGNLWANKKSFLDRAIEEPTGRSVYTLSNKLTGLVSASAIGFNPRSALSNAIGLLNSFPTLDAKRIPAAMARTIANGLSGNKDGFGTDIPFLVNRRSGYGGIQTRLSDKLKVKGSKAMYAMFEVMDYLTTETSARAKYDELRAKGYAEAEAGAKTSDYLMDVYADRTKGAAPTIFSKKSLKPIMQYQLEVMNQLFHFRDIDRQGVAEQVDRIMRDNGGTLDGIDFAAAENRIHGAGLPEIGRKLAYLLLLSAWGAVTRGLFGSDQSWNPVGMVTDAIDDYKAGGIKRAAAGLASTAADQLPFISTLAGGRIPVAAGASNFVDAIEAIAGGNTDKALTAAGKGVLSFVPGGGQINRTIQGAQAAERGGNYTDRGRLRYPIETGADKAKSIIFGASAAAPQGYRWGEDVLSDSETEAYDEAKARGVDDFDMYDFLLTGYDSSGKTTKLLSLAAADPPKDEVDIIAEVLGIDYKGNLDRAAKSAARDREKELKMQLKRGKIDQAAYDSKMATIDMYLAMLG